MIDQGLFTAVAVFVAVLVVVGVAALLAVAGATAHAPLAAWRQRRTDARHLRGIARATDESNFRGHDAAAAH
jgi:hypothetical protein